MIANELSALLHEDRRDRVRALRDLPASEAVMFAARRMLYTDRDARVRAAAARRLGSVREPIVEGWLADALADRSPMVRDAILRALSRVGSSASANTLRGLVEHDEMWWIRRGAIYALAAVAGAAELATFTRALGDPFWRVRHAAVRVLAVLGARDAQVRDEILTEPPSSALVFLRAAWGPVALEAPARAATTSRLPAHLLDPDPAVVTARLLADREVSAVALVELLCDPHAPLRVLAAERIAASGDHDAYRAALDWLEEPRIPHVVRTVHRLLDGLGDAAAELAAVALDRSIATSRPGAARWAIGWTLATRFEALVPAARDAARACDASVRAVAIPLLATDELASWATDPACSRELADEIAVELHGRHSPDSHAALLALPARSARTRALQLDVLARSSEWNLVEPAVFDPHHGPRAIAARWLVRAGRVDPMLVASDRDPAVREAGLHGETAAAALADPDPWVRRAAMRLLTESTVTATEATIAALGSNDPWLRAEACRIAISDHAHLARILELLGDRDEAVRAAALGALERLPSDDQVRALLATELDPATRVHAHAWLARRLDDRAGNLAREALANETDPRVRRLLGAVAGSPVVESIEARPERAPREIHEAAPRISANVTRRPFGRAGFEVAPLAISGAFDLSARALAMTRDAGVDLYFWESGYDELALFLRAKPQRDTRVITGSYHADARSIRIDVDRALHQLRRDRLDAFLLFWTRSPARLDAETFGVLADLKREGKIGAAGFSTHHRELAREAIEAQPWDVVMIRHSAAHPGIERELLPVARERNTAIITFSALCYGRLLTGPNAPSASECYRYSMAQPGVVACISAPRRYREAVENVAILREPPLTEERIAELRIHGAGVRVESQRFNTLLRQPTRDAAAAARELLAAELPPADSVPRRLPVATSAKRSRSRLGATRRGAR